ncbi:Sialin like protein [Argiope bruennichi]|uniref:Sialin like protein n=1 Tax=Argiope bruennichi TaxID=94029 RepID=A0A8T0FAZ9_ARGBR|nr:Sialin like protein [Argiope bruennichi]
MTLIFGHRVCLHVAMVAMVNSSAEVDLLQLRNGPQENSNFCPVPESSVNVTLNYKQGSYPWTPYTQGVILASYFYGYVVAQIIGGQISDFVGAARLFGGATLLSSILSCFTPMISTLDATYTIALRTILGFIHGMHYPSAYTLIARWAPLQERSTHLSSCVIGTHFGVVMSMPLTGYLCEHGFGGGWPSAFYLLGCAGFVWFLLWVFLVFESPVKHPRINAKELDYIQKNTEIISKEKKNASVPWLQVACSAPVWAVTVAKFCGAWSFMCFQSKLPAYLDDVLHMPIQKNGFVNALLFGALCISIIISGKLSDCIRRKYRFTITTIRKSFETIALLGPALCMAAIPLVRCNANAVVALLTSAMALFGLCGGGDVSVIVDMTPDFAGKIFGISNAIASIPGILAPVLAGYLLEGNVGDVQQWLYIFYISVGMYLFGAAFFLLFGSAEVQPWGRYCGGNTRTLSVKEANLIFTVPVILGVDNNDLKKDTSTVEMTRL